MTDFAYPRAQLPPNPPGIKMLSDAQSRGLNARLPGSVLTLDNCVTCSGRKTFRWRDASGSEAEYDCPCPDQYILSRYFYHSGVPLNYQRLGWHDFQHLDTEAAAEVGKYLERSEDFIRAGVGLCFHGPRGNGKTLLAFLLVKEMLGQGQDCYCTTFADMVSNFMGTWRDPDQERWFNQTVRNAGVLFIDDIGREYKPDRMDNRPGSVRESMLEAVIRHRVANCQPTIITTNLSPESITSGYGGHTMSLLLEKTIFVPVAGSDRRREMQEREKGYILQGLRRPVVVA